MTYYQMSITSNDEFIFYYINHEQEIERKVVDLNFKIKEVDADKSQYCIYEIVKKEEYCSKIFGCSNNKEIIGTEVKLIVPKGTITNDSRIFIE